MIRELRSYKIFGLALFDLVLSMVGLVLIFLLARHIHGIDLSPTPFIVGGIVLAIPIGIVFHVIFGTNTTLNYRLGLSHKPV